VLIKGSTAAEVIQNGENGFLCQADNEDFAQTIVRALSDREALARIGANAQRTLCRTWESIIDEVAQRYRLILDHWTR